MYVSSCYQGYYVTGESLSLSLSLYLSLSSSAGDGTPWDYHHCGVLLPGVFLLLGYSSCREHSPPLAGWHSVTGAFLLPGHSCYRGYPVTGAFLSLSTLMQLPDIDQIFHRTDHPEPLHLIIAIPLPARGGVGIGDGDDGGDGNVGYKIV